MIKQLWPNVNQFVRELVRDKIQPIIHEKLKKKNLKGFKFETIRLGSVVSINILIVYSLSVKCFIISLFSRTFEILILFYLTASTNWWS